MFTQGTNFEINPISLVLIELEINFIQVTELLAVRVNGVRNEVADAR